MMTCRSPGGRDTAVGDADAVSLRRATPADVPGLATLVDGFAREGLLLPRPARKLYRRVREFTLAFDGTEVIGCAALRIYSATTAEVSAVAVAPAWHGRGLGRRLVDHVISEARDLGLARVFAVTLRQETFFRRLGFRATAIEELFDVLDAEERAARSTDNPDAKTALVRTL